MTAFDYLVPLFAILMGLAIADLATSLHRLMRAGSRVRWHWFSISAAFLTLLITLEIWWALRSVADLGLEMTIGAVLPIVAELILLFLLASAAFPDDVPAEGLDLKAYYAANHRYFWSLFAGIVALFLVHRIGLGVALGGWARLPALLASGIPNLVTISLMTSLAWVRPGRWHAFWLAVMPFVFLADLLNRPLP
jgi:hypothetical protein